MIIENFVLVCFLYLTRYKVALQNDAITVFEVFFNQVGKLCHLNLFGWNLGICGLWKNVLKYIFQWGQSYL